MPFASQRQNSRAEIGATMMTRYRVALACWCLLALFAVARAQAPQPMPRISGESLAGQTVTLPDAAKGKVALLIFGFTKASKENTKAWGDRVLAEFGGQSRFELYQLPVLEDVPRLFRGMVISGIKKDVKYNLRDHFVPILHGEGEMKKLVAYREPDDAYMIVLNASGEIVQQTHGQFSDAGYRPMHDEIGRLLGH